MPNEVEDLTVRLTRTADAIADLTQEVDELGTRTLRAATDLEEARRLLYRLRGVLIPGFLHEEDCDGEDDGSCGCPDLAAFKNVMRDWTPPNGVARSTANPKET